MFKTILFICIFLGIGSGLLSCTFFLWAWLIGAPPAGLLWLLIVGYCPWGLVLYRSLGPEAPSHQGRASSLWAALFGLLCLYIGFLAVTRYRMHPHGDWAA
jgi:hypothetical protein